MKNVNITVGNICGFPLQNILELTFLHLPGRGQVSTDAQIFINYNKDKPICLLKTKFILFLRLNNKMKRKSQLQFQEGKQKKKCQLLGRKINKKKAIKKFRYRNFFTFWMVENQKRIRNCIFKFTKLLLRKRLLGLNT